VGSGAEKRSSWAGVGPFLAANVLFGAGLFAHAFLYNFYLDALGRGEAFMGLAASSMTAGGLIALAPAGFLLDRFGAARSYVLASLLGTAGLAWGALAESGAGILAGAMMAGAGTATWRVTMGPVLMAIAPPDIRSRAFSWNVAALLASGSVWTAAAGALPTWWSDLTGASSIAGIRAGLLLCAAGTLLSGPLAVRILGVTATPSSAPTGAPNRRGHGWRTLAVRPRIRLLVGLVLIWMLAAGMVLPFFNLYFLRVHGWSVERIGLLFGLMQAVTALLLVAGGELAQRAGPLRVLVGWVLFFPVALVGLAFAGGALLATVWYALQGLAPPATNPLLDELLLDEAAASERGAVSSWRNAATELSGLMGASAGGLLLGAGSFAALFTTAALVAAVGGGLLTRALARHPG